MGTDSIAHASNAFFQASANLSQHTIETLQIVALALVPVLVAVIGFLFKAYIGRMERNFMETLKSVEFNCTEKIKAQDVIIANITSQLTKERDDTLRDQKAILQRLVKIETITQTIKENLERKN